MGGGGKRRRGLVQSLPITNNIEEQHFYGTHTLPLSFAKTNVTAVFRGGSTAFQQKHRSPTANATGTATVDLRGRPTGRLQLVDLSTWLT